MNGNDLRQALAKRKINIGDLAKKLEMSQPNLSNQFRVQDVKSGFLERICDVLGVTLDFFYEATKYVDNQGRTKTVADTFSNNSPDLIEQLGEKDKEISFLKGKIEVLENVNKMLVSNNPQTTLGEVNLHQRHA